VEEEMKGNKWNWDNEPNHPEMVEQVKQYF